MARPSNYERLVEPHLNDIIEWRKKGATDEIIAKKLGVGLSTLYAYKTKYSELKEAFNVGTQDLVLELRGELIKLAFPHYLKTEKTYIRKDEETGNTTKYTEITKKEVDGNINAIHLLLKNYDKENWTSNPAELDLKKTEIEMKKELLEMQQKGWGDDL